jgi:hypothetical protein
MGSDEGKKIYKQRAATSETVNADLRSYRGLTQFTVRGRHKARCVVLWCALAYRRREGMDLNHHPRVLPPTSRQPNICYPLLSLTEN